MRQYPVDGGIEAVRESLLANARATTLLPACPLMHGTGWFTTNTCLAEGGRIVLLANRKYDPVELLDTVEREKVNGLVIVGDPFSRPLLGALDAHPGHWDLSSLVLMISSGAMWSESIKKELLRHHPGMLLVDAFSSSEALGMGMSVSGAGNAAATAKFTLGPDVKVLKDDGTEVTPGSDEVGVLALGRPQPSRLLQGRGEVRPHVQDDQRRALLRAGRLRPGGRATGRSTCSAAARSASTRAARRSFPRRWRRRSRRTRPYVTPSSWASPTRYSARRSWA